jgi:molybdate transport system substrate-binding protein
LVILSREGLALLERDGLVQPGTGRDLVRSEIGMAVRRGAPIPDISTPDKFRGVLLAAPSIGYSASASGTYLATDLWPRLGLAEQLLPKAKRVLSERVGAVVARGEVAIGFQQMSELLPISGITVVGPIPAAYQKVTIFTAATTPQGARNPATREFLSFVTSPVASRQVAATGLSPVRDR